MTRTRIGSVLFVAVLTAFSLCASAAAPSVPADDLKPLYGGVDRQSIPEFKAHDDKFVADAVREYGSREAASKARVIDGADLFMDDDLDNAMRRFNEAWLLDPGSPSPYLGFASIFLDQDRYCEAMNMIEVAETKGHFPPAFYPDAGIAFTGCALDAKRTDPDLAYWYLNRADVFFENAYNHPDVRRQATLFHWARAMYARHDYAAAWEKVAEYRRHTGKDFNGQFLRALRQKMPEPRRQVADETGNMPRHAALVASDRR